MRHPWLVQAGYSLVTAPGVRPPGRPPVPGCLWELVDGESLVMGVRVRARSADEALALVERRVRETWSPPVLPVRRGADVRRAGWSGFRRRRPVRIPGSGTAPGPEGGGPAGVREPRRPHPSMPSAAVRLPLPGDPAAA